MTNQFTIQQLDADMNQSQNIVFVDAEPSYKTEIAGMADPTFAQASKLDADLGEFLSRPILIHDYTWTHGNEINYTFNPWVDYFSDSRVQQKISNFFLLRCKLVIRVQINATPFHLGSAMLTYNPLQNVADNVDPTSFAGSSGQALTTISQRPRVLIDASTSQGGTMVVPFMWPDNALRVPEITDFQNMGQCRIDSFTRLFDSNATGGDVNVSVWVHAQDVELCIPTSGAPFTPQAGKNKSAKSEYSQPGPVSGVASQVASVADSLADTPVIGPFAMATSIGANAVSGIARIFGWSRPAVIDDIQRYKPLPAGEFATTDSKDTVTKLTLTSKQELTVDPRTVGLSDVDEMSILGIASKESYIGRFYWDVNDTATTTLYTAGVTPSFNSLISQVGPPAYKEVYPTAISFASSPFQYWSGSIKFRFKIVCSRFHRGRLRITFDPYYNNTVSTLGANFNTAYQHVLDLAQTRDISIEVPWAQAVPYLKTSPLFDSHLTGRGFRKPIWGDAAAVRPAAGDQTNIQNQREYCNGFINIIVQNELKSPNKDDAIEILVFVSAGDDFEVAGPKGNMRQRDNAGAVQLQPFVPQSGLDANADVGEVDQRNEDENAPELTKSDAMFEQQAPKMYDLKPRVFFGERITSFRSLCKRYTYYCAVNWQTATTVVNTKFMAHYQTRMGTKLQYVGDRTARSRYGVGIFPELNMLMHQYLMRAYAGYRGSLRHKWVVHIPKVGENNTVVSHVMVSRVNYNPVSWSNTYLQITDAYNSFANEVINRTDQMFGGGTVAFTVTNNAIEAEVPFYRPKRFGIARNLNNNGIAIDASDNDVLELSFVAQCPTTSTTVADMQKAYDRVYADMYTAVGEDFNMFFFVGAPVFYYI